MIVLDTNVISKAMRSAPEPRVIAWHDRLDRDEVFTTAISEAEILHGIALLPEGKRRRELRQLASRLFSERLAGRVLAFDRVAADHFAVVASARRSAGTPILVQDAQIAAIARAHGGIIATRNTGDFSDTGAVVVNPWG